MHWKRKTWKRAGTFHYDKNTEHQADSAAGPGELQNVTIYGPICSIRPLLNWEAHKKRLCIVSIINNRITTDRGDIPCLMEGAASSTLRHVCISTQVVKLYPRPVSRMLQGFILRASWSPSTPTKTALHIPVFFLQKSFIFPIQSKSFKERAGLVYTKNIQSYNEGVCLRTSIF